MVQRLFLVVIGLALLAAPALAQVPNRDAPVRNIRVNDTNPMTVTVRGTLPTPCYSLLPPEQTVEGSTIVIRLGLRPPVSRMCAQVITPFEEIIPVDVAGLAPGQYTLVVNGVSALFTLAETGAPAPANAAPAADCPTAGADQTAYRDDDAGFCLLYPASFDPLPSEPPNTTAFALRGESAVRPSLVIAYEPANSRTLDEMAQAQQLAYPDLTIPFTEAAIGGLPAIVTEAMPGTTGSRHAFVFANEVLYVLVAQPVDTEQPIATATTNELWRLVTESLVFFPAGVQLSPAATEQRLDDLGIVFALPEGWTVERHTDGYGLIAPEDVLTLTVGGAVYPVSFGALNDLPADDLDALAVAAIQHYEAQGERRLSSQQNRPVGDQPPSVMLYGFLKACSVTLIPRAGGVTTVTVSSLMCDLDNRITNAAVQAIVDSVRLIGE